MASRLNPYISFSGTAREAMEFYQSIFGGHLTLSTFGEFGMADTPFADQIMHALLETPDGYALMGADTPPGMEVQAGSSITISLSGDDEESLRRHWDGLSADGVVETPLERQMWGDLYGACTDRYGVRWMVDITGAPAS